MFNISFELSALDIRYIVACRLNYMNTIEGEKLSIVDVKNMIIDHLTYFGMQGLNKDIHVDLPGYIERYLTELYPDLFPVFEHVLNEKIKLDDGYEYEVITIGHTFISLLMNKTGKIINLSHSDLMDHKI